MVSMHAITRLCHPRANGCHPRAMAIGWRPHMRVAPLPPCGGREKASTPSSVPVVLVFSRVKRDCPDCHPGARPRYPSHHDLETRRLTGAAQRALRSLGQLLLLLALGFTCIAPAAHAVEPDEILKDQGLEFRARNISGDLRCLVCQNQSIDDSNASLARDLRLLVRERLTKGDSDSAVRAFIVERYGEFVLLRPPLSVRTSLLWLTPLLLLALITVTVLRRLKSSASVAARAPEPAPLTRDEQARLDQILKRDS